jgi:hypothetical protein
MRKAIAFAPLLVAACTTMATNEPTPPAHGESAGYECRREGLDAFVGREPTAELAAEILAKSGAKAFRWLQPGQIVTMEFRSDRVNAYIGANNRIERVTCG